jgi:peptidyl-prolyl cis-trans isomerase C
LSGCATATKITDNDLLSVELKADNASGVSNQKEDTVLARINGEKITMSEYNEQMKRLSTFEKAKYRGEEGHKEFLNELILRKLMLQNARKIELDKDSEVQKKIEILMRDVTERVLVETLIKREVWDKVVVTDKEAKAYYDEHEDEFKENEQIRIRHILVKTEEEARQIRQELEAGVDFARLAKDKSIDQKTAKLEGDLGYFERGRLLPEFEKSCFGLKVGEVSEVVKTKFGYHIIKLEDEKEASIKEFYEAKGEIKEQLIFDKQREKYQEWIRQIEENAKIEIDEDFFRK